MLRVACFAALAASASALVAPPARGAAALSSRLAPLEVQKGSIVRIMRPESCAAASETLRGALRRSGFTRRASFRRRARRRWNRPPRRRGVRRWPPRRRRDGTTLRATSLRRRARETLARRGRQTRAPSPQVLGQRAGHRRFRGPVERAVRRDGPIREGELPGGQQ